MELNSAWNWNTKEQIYFLWQNEEKWGKREKEKG